jgi:uncharacterized DUF497 family protein
MFEWDERKSESNLAKHGVTFASAQQVFERPMLTNIDERQDYGEVRQVSIGVTRAGDFLVVVHTQRGDRQRLISARPASSEERSRYERTVRSAIDFGRVGKPQG